MSRRTERIGSLIRSTIGQLILVKMADPRIDPACVSVTRVEMPEDLLTAKVFVSVMGTEGQQRAALHALRHAAGHLQERMMEVIRLRNTPLLSFELDEQFKKTLQTYDIIAKAMEEIHRKESRLEQEQKENASAQEQASGEAPPAPKEPSRP